MVRIEFCAQKAVQNQGLTCKREEDTANANDGRAGIEMAGAERKCSTKISGTADGQQQKTRAKRMNCACPIKTIGPSVTQLSDKTKNERLATHTLGNMV
jgi:hypothetical protein